MRDVLDFDGTPNAVGLGWRGLGLFGLVCMVYSQASGGDGESSPIRSSHGRSEAANGSLGFLR
jgi:hypothetical protein